MTDFKKILKSKDEDAIQLIRSMTDPNMFNKEGLPLLTYLLVEYSWADPDGAKLLALLEAGANPNIRDRDGSTPLIEVINNCEDEVPIRRLLDARVDLNMPDTNGVTPLLHAEKTEIIELLIATGADVNAPDAEGKSPLMKVAGNDTRWNSTTKQVDRLLKARADVGLRDNKGNTALHFACGAYSPGNVIASLLDAGSDINAANAEGLTPIIRASDASLKVLLPYSPNLNIQDKEGKTALMHAACDIDRLKLLLSAGPELNIQDAEGKTALMHAASNYRKSGLLSELLIKAGADLDIVDKQGKSATAHAQPEALRRLIAAGAKPNPHESVPLSYAQSENDYPLMIMLFSRGAKLRLKFPIIVKFKKTLQKLARARPELLKAGVKLMDGESREAFEKLFSGNSGSPIIASDDELPGCLRKSGAGEQGSTAIVIPYDHCRQHLPVRQARLAWAPEDLKQALKIIPMRRMATAVEDSQNAIEKFRKNPKRVELALLCGGNTNAFVQLWNDHAVKVVQFSTSKFNYRLIERMGADQVMGLLARFSLDILPGLLDLERKKPNLVSKALRHVDAVECALPMARQLDCNNGRIAQAWMRAFPETAILGLLPYALGPLGKDRDVANGGLSYLVRHGQTNQLRQLVMPVGTEAAQAIDDLVASIFTTLPARLPALPAFWCPDIHPSPCLKGSGHKLSNHSLDTIARLMLASTIDFPAAPLEAITPTCTQESLAEFVWSVFEDWAEKGSKDTDGMFQALGYWGDDTCARRLSTYIREWPRSSNTPRALMGLEILAQIGTDTALAELQSFALRSKYRKTQERANELVEASAKRRNLTRQQFEDRTVPMLGLNADGWMRLDFGGRQFLAGVDEKFRPTLHDDSHQRIKDLPKTGKADVETLAAQATAEWKQFRGELKSVAKLQLARLEQAMLSGRRWSGADFQQWLVAHPLLAPAVRGLVWGVFRGRQQLVKSFAIQEGGKFVDATGKGIQIGATASVGIPHPLDLSDTVMEWMKWFSAEKRSQPFAQLTRSAFRRSEDLNKDCFGLNGAVVPSKGLKVLKSHGWDQEIGDAGWIWGFDKKGCTVNPEPGVHIDDYEWGGATEQKLEVSLSEKLNDIDYSEIVRELQALRK